MPPSPATKRKSRETDLDAAPRHDGKENARTPTGSPARKRLRITSKQKQVLIDNLQLEGACASMMFLGELLVELTVLLHSQ